MWGDKRHLKPRIFWDIGLIEVTTVQQQEKRMNWSLGFGGGGGSLASENRMIMIGSGV